MITTEYRDSMLTVIDRIAAGSCDHRFALKSLRSDPQDETPSVGTPRRKNIGSVSPAPHGLTRFGIVVG